MLKFSQRVEDGPSTTLPENRPGNLNPVCVRSGGNTSIQHYDIFDSTVKVFVVNIISVYNLEIISYIPGDSGEPVEISGTSPQPDSLRPRDRT